MLLTAHIQLFWHSFGAVRGGCEISLQQNFPFGAAWTVACWL